MQNVINETDLQLTEAPRIIWMRVRDAVGLLWEKNPKLHDIGGIVESLKKHGLQELPKYDATLGAIKAGNGRVEALAWMETQNKKGEGPPRGVGWLQDSGEWCLPVLVGIDAESTILAEAYAIDSNNLTMMGGDFTAIDIMRLWEPETYAGVLVSLAEQDALPVSVDGNDLEAILKYIEDQNKNAEDTRGYLLDKFKEFGLLDSQTVYDDGSVFLLGGRHVLIKADVFSQWDLYVHYLQPGDIFIPLPGVYILGTEIAQTHRLILVQPDNHLFDLLLQASKIIYDIDPVPA